MPLNSTKKTKPIDVSRYAGQLKNYILFKNDKNALVAKLSYHQINCDQFLTEITQDLKILTQLNQPKYQLPNRIKNLIPFRYSNKLCQFVLRCYNFISRPQHKINNQLHMIALNSLKATHEILLEQKKQSNELQQQISVIENRLSKLCEAFTNKEENQSILKEDNF